MLIVSSLSFVNNFLLAISLVRAPCYLTKVGKDILAYTNQPVVKIAGKSVANPIAQILSGALLLAHSFNMTETASRIENAIHEAIRSGARTNDIANKKLFTKDKEETISTIEMGQEIKLKLT